MTEEARARALDRLYGQLDRLRDRCGGYRRLAECTGAMDWPTRGVYFFFEPGEVRADGVTPRVVRVGTHALRAGSSTTLWNRLAQHRGNQAGRQPGGGNHRGSIFRLHVGAALLARGFDDPDDDIATTWRRGSSAPREVRETEYPLERAVSEHIGAMPFLWLEVPDPPGPGSRRGVIEAGVIALLSNRGRTAVDAPSPRWLGRWSDSPAIRESGLWNVNHVDERPLSSVLEVFERLLEPSHVGEAGPITRSPNPSRADSAVRPRRIGLVGCVKSKRGAAAPARDLYTSPLFRGRRCYVEQTCDRWFVLSALHGLVDPDTVLEPYDVSLTHASRLERQRWSSLVLAALEREIGRLDGLVFEIHAGAAYRDHGLVRGLRERGATVEIPAAGLNQGQQLAFYKDRRRAMPIREVRA